jgi:hypothetical protein
MTKEVITVLRFMACYYLFGHCIVCPSHSDLWLAITPLAIVLSVLLHCIVCPQIYCLLLPLWPLYYLSFSDLWLVITPLVIVLSVLTMAKGVITSNKSEDRQYNDQRGNNKP